MQREGLSLLVLHLDNSRLEFGRCSDAEIYRTTGDPTCPGSGSASRGSETGWIQVILVTC